MTLIEQRAAEHAKYDRVYQSPDYRMGEYRLSHAVADLAALPTRGSYLDVSCGRGEMLRYAMTLGFGPIQGTEVVSRLCHHPDIIWAEAHYLPFVDHSFDVVSMFDVMEHLIPGDDEAACRELDRVARHHVLLTANDQHSTMGGGEELHINLRSHTEWDVLFRRWFHGCVTWLGGDQSYPAQRWRIDYA